MKVAFIGYKFAGKALKNGLKTYNNLRSIYN